MKKRLIAACLLVVFSSCNQEDILLQKENSNDDSIVTNQQSARINTGCSYSFSGKSMGWSKTGELNLDTHISTDKKYVWRADSGILNSNLGTRLQFKVTLKTAYSIRIRVVGVKQNYLTIPTETYSVYDGCYDLTTNGTSKEFDFFVPVHKNIFGSLEADYSYFDFEIIVFNNTFTNKYNSTVPVIIKTCRSSGAGCSNY